jgi:type I restriction enzyme M protein
LLEEHLEKIIATYTHRSTEDKFSRAVPMSEIEANEYNLNISRYVNTTTAEAEIDLLEVHTKIKTLEAQAKSATDEHNKFLAELGLPLL